MNKHLVFWLTLTFFIGGSVLQAQSLSWPPDEQGLLETGPLVILLGPVYEAVWETEQPLHQELLAVLKRMGQKPKVLPEFFHDRIGKLKHILFHPGYKNDEEWGAIKTLRQSGQEDPERIAGILEVNPINHPEGLELAMRLIPPETEHPTHVTLEGYRFIKQPSGKGEAEWYEIRVPLSGKSSEGALTEAITWLLLKPFEAQGVRFPVAEQTLPYWQGARVPGQLYYAQNFFRIDRAPVPSEFVRACPRSACPRLGTKKKYAAATSRQQAEEFCRSLDRELVPEPTLLLMHNHPETRSLLDDAGPAAWGRSGGSAWGRHEAKPVEFETSYQHHDSLRKQDTGIVWCQPKQQAPQLTFSERSDSFVLKKLGLKLVWHERGSSTYGTASGTLYQLEGETITTLLDTDPEHPTVRRSWILRNPLAEGVVENRAVQVSSYDDSYSGLLLQVYPGTLTLQTSTSTRQYEVVMRKIGISGGNWYRSWSGGIGYTSPMFKKLEVRTMTGSTELLISWGGYVEVGFDRPLWFLTGVLWGGYVGGSGFFYFGSTAPLLVPNLEARVSYRLSDSFNFFGGLYLGSGTNTTPQSTITGLGITASSLSTGLHWTW